MMDEAEAKKLVEAALAGTGEATATLTGGVSALTRFGDNVITQNVDTSRRALALTVSIDRRSATVVSNKFDAPLARRAAELARLSPEDPEHVEPLGPQAYAKIAAYFPAKFGPRKRAEAVLGAIEVARQEGLTSYGAMSDSETFAAIGNSKGLWGYHRETSSGFSVTMRTGDGSGSSRASHEAERKMERLDPKSLCREAAERALESKGAKEIPPGDYTVVLRPEAAAEFVSWLGMSLGAREADEGLSALSGKLGTRFLSERVSLRTEPGNEDILAAPFDGEGLPVRDITWVEQGVLRRLQHTRHWAQKQGKEATAAPTALVLDGGEAKSVDELVSGVKKGLLITRFWYIRMVDAKALLLTGLTRDGVFWIEGGKVSHPVINYRFNVSPLTVFSNVEAMTRPRKVGAMKVPAVLTSGFTLSSPSRAV